jgi:(p)ppGpp synthase/HD superfamily hydrolase
MEALEEGDEQIVALLHDVLEDTTVDVAELYELGFGEHIVRAVLLLTHDGTVPYAEHIERLADDPLARRVKLADLADNLRNNRRLESTDGVRARISRYEAAQQHVLEACSRAD